MKRLYRSKIDKMVAGICGGVAEYLEIDPTIVRLVVVFLAIITGILPALLVYILGIFIIPEQKNGLPS